MFVAETLALPAAKYAVSARLIFEGSLVDMAKSPLGPEVLLVTVTAGLVPERVYEPPCWLEIAVFKLVAVVEAVPPMVTFVPVPPLDTNVYVVPATVTVSLATGLALNVIVPAGSVLAVMERVSTPVPFVMVAVPVPEGVVLNVPVWLAAVSALPATFVGNTT
jgi:hypothetical protein